MLTVAFDESIMRRTQVQLWYKMSMTMLVRPKRLSTSTTNESIEAVKKIILDNHPIAIRERLLWHHNGRYACSSVLWYQGYHSKLPTSELITIQIKSQYVLPNTVSIKIFLQTTVLKQ